MTSSEFVDLRDFISGEMQKVHVRLDRMEARQDRMKADHLEFQALVAKHFEQVYALLGDMQGRMARLETRMEDLQSDFRALGEDLRSTNGRLDEFREETNRRFDEQRDFTTAGFRDWGMRVERIEARLGEAA